MTRMHSADYTVAVYSSVRPSVCLSHAGIMSSSKFFHRRVAPDQTKRDGNIPTDASVMGASNASGYEKITIFDQYLALSQI